MVSYLWLQDDGCQLCASSTNRGQNGFSHQEFIFSANQTSLFPVLKMWEGGEVTKPKRKSPEADLQIAIVEWFELAYPDHAKWLHHSPNGGKRSISEAVRFKKMGVKKGFPDLVLYVKKLPYSVFGGIRGLAMEVKAKGQKETKEQAAWLLNLHNQDYACYVVDNVDEATKIFIRYMDPILPRVKV